MSIAVTRGGGRVVVDGTDRCADSNDSFTTTLDVGGRLDDGDEVDSGLFEPPSTSVATTIATSTTTAATTDERGQQVAAGRLLLDDAHRATRPAITTSAEFIEGHEALVAEVPRHRAVGRC